jgi:hypothetical protein
MFWVADWGQSVILQWAEAFAVVSIGLMREGVAGLERGKAKRRNLMGNRLQDNTKPAKIFTKTQQRLP